MSDTATLPSFAAINIAEMAETIQARIAFLEKVIKGKTSDIYDLKLVLHAVHVVAQDCKLKDERIAALESEVATLRKENVELHNEMMDGVERVHHLNDELAKANSKTNDDGKALAANLTIQGRRAHRLRMAMRELLNVTNEKQHSDICRKALDVDNDMVDKLLE